MNSGDESAATGPGQDSSRPAGTGPVAELIGQMQSLHRSTEEAAASSSPLGQRLIADLRTGTYRRLAPMVQALDGTFEPVPHPRVPEVATSGTVVPIDGHGQVVRVADPHPAETQCQEGIDGTAPPAPVRRTRVVQWLRTRTARTGKRRATS